MQNLFQISEVLFAARYVMGLFTKTIKVNKIPRKAEKSKDAWSMGFYTVI